MIRRATLALLALLALPLAGCDRGALDRRDGTRLAFVAQRDDGMCLYDAATPDRHGLVEAYVFPSKDGPPCKPEVWLP